LGDLSPESNISGPSPNGDALSDRRSIKKIIPKIVRGNQVALGLTII
jgi:hypothetical protein